MRFIKILVLSGLLVAVLAAGAYAQRTDWSGFYIGGTAGYTLGKSDAATTTMFSPTGYFATTSPGAIATAGAQSLAPTGILAGAQAGFNVQVGSLVLGIEADFGYSGLKGTATATGIYPCCAPTNFTVSQTVTSGWLFTARPRIGFVAGSLLIYGTGGLAMTNIDYQAVFTDTFANAAENGGVTQTLTGWAAGGGLEFGLSSQFSLKAEYLYVSFGQVTATSNNMTAYTPPISFPTNTFTHTTTLSGHVIRGGINIRF